MWYRNLIVGGLQGWKKSVAMPKEFNGYIINGQEIRPQQES